MIINVNLFDKESIKKAVNQVEDLKLKVAKINEEFIKESVNWIKQRANYYLDKSSHFQNTTDIREKWEINILLNDGKGNLNYELVNKSEFAVLVEFGTGKVGRKSAHPKARATGYQYGKKKWTFIRDIQSKEFVVNSLSVYKDAHKQNPQRYVLFRDFNGYKGKAFLYNAIFDYFDIYEFAYIYDMIYHKYIPA